LKERRRRCEERERKLERKKENRRHCLEIWKEEATTIEEEPSRKDAYYIIK